MHKLLDFFKKHKTWLLIAIAFITLIIWLATPHLLLAREVIKSPKDFSVANFVYRKTFFTNNIRTIPLLYPDSLNRAYETYEAKNDFYSKEIIYILKQFYDVENRLKGEKLKPFNKVMFSESLINEVFNEVKKEKPSPAYQEVSWTLYFLDAITDILNSTIDAYNQKYNQGLYKAAYVKKEVYDLCRSTINDIEVGNVYIPSFYDIHKDINFYSPYDENNNKDNFFIKFNPKESNKESPDLKTKKINVFLIRTSDDISEKELQQAKKEFFDKYKNPKPNKVTEKETLDLINYSKNKFIFNSYLYNKEDDSDKLAFICKVQLNDRGNTPYWESKVIFPKFEAEKKIRNFQKKSGAELMNMSNEELNEVQDAMHDRYGY